MQIKSARNIHIDGVDYVRVHFVEIDSTLDVTREAYRAWKKASGHLIKTNSKQRFLVTKKKRGKGVIIWFQRDHKVAAIYYGSAPTEEIARCIINDATTNYAYPTN